MNADICILGSGIAGLRCGITLLQKRPSSKLVILEKYNYNGGRVVTYHKTIEDIQGKCSKLQWENGAGRIHANHTKVLDLVKRYKLHAIPISDTLLYEEDGIRTQNIFTDTMRLLTTALEALPADYLATHTLRQVLTMVLGHEETEALLLQYPYRSEVDTLRADLGLLTFQEEMGTYKGYFGVKEGLSAIIQGMVKEFTQLGGTIVHDQEVVSIQKEGSMLLVKTNTKAGPVLWEAHTVIAALHRDACKSITPLHRLPVLSYLKMEPLVRTYAVFPTTKGNSWFGDLPKITSSGLLRFFIPINPSCGITMLSYTDGQDARKVLDLLDKEGEEKTGDILVEAARRSFPDKQIPEPLFFKAHPWTSGCTYWLPGAYNPEEESKKVLKPFNDWNLYCCGESFSLKQAWMEGALEHADLLLAHYF